jgi:hypothetical protein
VDRRFTGPRLGFVGGFRYPRRFRSFSMSSRRCCETVRWSSAAARSNSSLIPGSSSTAVRTGFSTADSVIDSGHKSKFNRPNHARSLPCHLKRDFVPFNQVKQGRTVFGVIQKTNPAARAQRGCRNLTLRKPFQSPQGLKPGDLSMTTNLVDGGARRKPLFAGGAR